MSFFPPSGVIKRAKYVLNSSSAVFLSHEKTVCGGGGELWCVKILPSKPQNGKLQLWSVQSCVEFRWRLHRSALSFPNQKKVETKISHKSYCRGRGVKRAILFFFAAIEGKGKGGGGAKILDSFFLHLDVFFGKVSSEYEKEKKKNRIGGTTDKPSKAARPTDQPANNQFSLFLSTTAGDRVREKEIGNHRFILHFPNKQIIKIYLVCQCVKLYNIIQDFGEYSTSAERGGSPPSFPASPPAAAAAAAAAAERRGRRGGAIHHSKVRIWMTDSEEEERKERRHTTPQQQQQQQPTTKKNPKPPPLLSLAIISAAGKKEKE